MSTSAPETEIRGSKKPLDSKSIVASIVVILIGVANLLDLPIEPEEIESLSDRLVSLWDEALIILGSLRAIYGRIVAEKRIQF